MSQVEAIDDLVIQKRPREEKARVTWFVPYGMGRLYPRDSCPCDPMRRQDWSWEGVSQTHRTFSLLNRFAGKEMLYCATCVEWFPIDEKAYRG